MNCIIVDDEPIARKGIEKLVVQIPELKLLSNFNSAETASIFLLSHPVELIFLDIQMPGINGIEFARSIPGQTLIIFTTAYSEFALDSYEVEAIDYLVKPIHPERFRKAVDKALAYHSLLISEENKKDFTAVENMENEYFFVKSDRRYFKVYYKEILFVEGLKDYIILQSGDKRIITRMTLKNMEEMLPPDIFMRVNRSYIVNLNHIDSFDNNDIFIRKYEIGIGNMYRDIFFERYMGKRRESK